MRVTAILYQPPGRGESISRSMEMPDTAMPATPADFALRSVRALKFFWPDVNTGKAMALDVCDQRNVVHGSHWDVEWATDHHINVLQGFCQQRIALASTVGELLAAAALIQPTKVVTL
jgi:hypothetical protein